MPALSPVKKVMSTRGPVVAAALLLLLAVQVIPAMRTKSATSDEFSHHIASGYSYLLTNDFRMNPASPPLPRMLTAVPLLFLGAKAPLDHDSWITGDSPEFARQFFYRYNPGRLDEFVFWARFPVVLLSIIFGLCLYVWGKRLFGETAGLAALILYVFCPDILAHSGLATADLCVALFFFTACMRFGQYLHKPTAKNLVVTGVMAGLTFLSKFSALALCPVLLLTALAAGKRKEIALPKTLAFLGVTLFVIWAGYGFEMKPLLKHTPDPTKKITVLKWVGGPTLVRFAQEVPIPLSTFSSAVISMGVTRAEGTNAYLMGAWSRAGWWYYYFVAFAVKNTIPFLLFGFAGFWWVLRAKVERVWKAVLLIPPVFFFAATMPDRAQAGIRYFLPVYPMVMLAGGAFASDCFGRGKVARGIVAALLVWHAAETLAVFPDHLTYFNEIAGGPRNGYKWLRDSNIDWGQDLKGLGELVRAEQYSEVALVFYGPVDPAYYKIPYRKLDPGEYQIPRKTVYAVGVHLMDDVRWISTALPSHNVGNSIYVYDFRDKDLKEF